MALSGSINFIATGKQIVTAALNLITERAAEVPTTNSEIADGLNALNRMVKGWQAQGLHLWKMDEGILFLREGVNKFTVGTGSTTTSDQATLEDDFISTTLSAAFAAGVNTITVASTVGMKGLIDSSAADVIGIRLTDGTRQWTTIENVNSTTSLQITDVLTGAATLDDSVFTYTSPIEKPLRVHSMRRTRFGQDQEVELEKWSRQQYFAQTLKTSQGTPTNFYFTPEISSGRFRIWQTANDVDQFLRFTFERTIQDFDISTNNPDFPVEWTDTLVWNLAARIGLEYGVALQELQLVTIRAEQMLEDLLGWDEEVTSLNVQPDYG